jgi:hypothetical protein
MMTVIFIDLLQNKLKTNILGIKSLEHEIKIYSRGTLITLKRNQFLSIVSFVSPQKNAEQMQRMHNSH